MELNIPLSGEDVPQKEEIYLLPLRKEIRIFVASRSRSKGDEWNLYDPFRQAFFRIGWVEFQLLGDWTEGQTVEGLCKIVNSKGLVKVSPEKVMKIQEFLLLNELVRVNSQEYTQKLYQLHQSKKGKWLKKLLHTYLFFRIPLVKPDEILEKLSRYVRPVSMKTVAGLLVFSAFLGLYLLSREWESFKNTFLYFFNFSGMLYYGIVLVIVKIAHELGHALTAKHYGLRVSTMGVALLVLFPVLYTDVTDAWKLKSKKARLLITASGMLVELALAVFATLLWSFLPEGVLKSAVFLVATVTWIMAAMINFNIFLRFDGYYFLSDWLEIPNLSERSFAIGRWKLRNMLFGLNEPKPESFSRGKTRFLVSYAFMTWLYRLVLFLGIAVLVYYFFFKVLGIFLMIVEVIWFILLPVWKELKEWHKMKDKIRLNWVTARNFVLLLGIFALFFVPWKATIESVAYIKPKESSKIFSPEEGIVKKIHVVREQMVRKGDRIAEIESTELQLEIEKAALKVKTLQWFMERKESSLDLVGHLEVTKQQLFEAKAELQGLLERRDTLTIKAPIDGTVTNLNELLFSGTPVGKETLIMSLSDMREHEVESFVLENEISRILVGNNAMFYPDHLETPPIELKIIDVEKSNSSYLFTPWLASIYGGEVAVKKDDKNRLETHEAVYRVRMKALMEEESLPFMLRGVVSIEAERESLVKRFYQRVGIIAIRESGF